MFEWKPYSQHATGPYTVYACNGRGVARLNDRLDGTWFAMLDHHLPWERQPPWRDCTSLEAGKRGVEMWAERHSERLHREVAEIFAEWARHQRWRG